MKVIEKYQCEKCEKVFSDEAGAEHCENSHIKIIKAEPKYSEGSKYPNRIVVTFSDGKQEIFTTDDDLPF